MSRFLYFVANSLKISCLFILLFVSHGEPMSVGLAVRVGSTMVGVSGFRKVGRGFVSTEAVMKSGRFGIAGTGTRGVGDVGAGSAFAGCAATSGGGSRSDGASPMNLRSCDVPSPLGNGQTLGSRKEIRRDDYETWLGICSRGIRERKPLSINADRRSLFNPDDEDIDDSNSDIVSLDTSSVDDSDVPDTDAYDPSLQLDDVCESDYGPSWFEPKDNLPCENGILIDLKDCGRTCRRSQELTIGRCLDSKCKCCTMFDSNGWFTSRGYTIPCIGESPLHNVACDTSCWYQGAKRGKCELNNCMCFMNDP